MNKTKIRNSKFRVLALSALFAVAVVLIVAPAQAQTPSTDRENPTALTGNSINGIGVNQKAEYFYSFAATPGDVKISLTVAANKQAAVSSVDISVFDADANALLSAYANPDHGSTAHATRTINIKSAQTFLLQVTVSPGVSTFKILLSGSLSLPSPAGKDTTDTSAAADSISIGGGVSPVDPADIRSGLLKPPPNQVIEGTGTNKKTQRVFEFSAGPGDVRLQLNVKSLANAAVSSVDIELLDTKQTEIAAGFANPSLGESKQTIVKADIQQKQTLTLKVTVSPGVANYALTVSGAVNTVLDEPAKSARLNKAHKGYWAAINIAPFTSSDRAFLARVDRSDQVKESNESNNDRLDNSRVIH